MPKIIEGKIVAKGMKFGIVASRFNDFICGRLIDGAIDALMRAGAEEKDIAIYKVPVLLNCRSLRKNWPKALALTP